MPRDVVGRDRGAGQDELARLGTIIHRSSNAVPDRRLDLPLVDESWRRAVEHQRRIHRDRRSRISVNVEQNLARRDLPGGGGLPACLRPLDYNGADSVQARRELAIGNPG
jgi:hypothetical protein